MSYTFAKSQALFERAQRSIAGGVNSGIRKLETPVPLYFSHGRGARIWDVDGRELIDLVGTWGPAILGHAPVPVIEAILKERGIV